MEQTRSFPPPQLVPRKGYLDERQSGHFYFALTFQYASLTNVDTGLIFCLTAFLKLFKGSLTRELLIGEIKSLSYFSGQRARISG